MIKIDENNIEKEVLNSDVPVILDFYSERCMPCKMLAPALEEISEEYADKIKVAKVDADENDELVMKYRVMSLPTLLYFKDGSETDRTTGPITKEKILEKVNEGNKKF